LEGKTVSSGQYVMSQQDVRYECSETPWRKLEKIFIEEFTELQNVMI